VVVVVEGGGGGGAAPREDGGLHGALLGVAWAPPAAQRATLPATLSSNNPSGRSWRNLEGGPTHTHTHTHSTRAMLLTHGTPAAAGVGARPPAALSQAVAPLTHGPRHRAGRAGRVGRPAVRTRAARSSSSERDVTTSAAAVMQVGGRWRARRCCWLRVRTACVNLGQGLLAQDVPGEGVWRATKATQRCRRARGDHAGTHARRLSRQWGQLGGPWTVHYRL